VCACVCVWRVWACVGVCVRLVQQLTRTGVSTPLAMSTEGWLDGYH